MPFLITQKCRVRFIFAESFSAIYIKDLDQIWDCHFACWDLNF